ncbi:MAG: maleylpyruvate isomerase family mycothiol-dependent enzyme [Sporichthyaceae bacterium]|nr:maleylpyruvate isomerase family mycothiol-dependent enzyme [Sporichthyaceae bacterium]
MTFEDYVDAWWQTSGSLVVVCEQLPDELWDTPTECPGWSVKDVAAHVTGVESMLLGRPRPRPTGPIDAPYIRNDVGRLVEPDVQVRRPLPPATVLAELREVLQARHSSLRESPPDPDAPIMWIQGPTTMTGMMRMRVFDVWAHEQDIRRAVDQPGNLTGPAAEVAKAVIVTGLPKIVAKRAAASPGSSVLIETTGPTPFGAVVTVDADGRGALAPPPWPTPTTATIALDWSELVRLSCGRCDPTDATVTLSGDTDLGWRVVSQLAVTP